MATRGPADPRIIFVILTKAFRFDVKADKQAGQFSGRASVYGNVDAHNDVVMPGAFARTLKANGGKVKVLSQHDPTKSIGWAMLEDSPLALNAIGELVLELNDAQQEYVRLKSGLIDGISIGYSVADGGAKYNASGVRELNDIDLWEISLVTFPANDFARVTDVKSGRLADLAAGIARELKAGRMLSSANRTTVGQAHEHMKSALGLLQGLLDACSDDEDAKARAFRSLKQSLQIKDMSDILSAASFCDSLISALDDAYDQLMAALGITDPDGEEVYNGLVQPETKGALKSSLPVGPDNAWDSGAAESRVRNWADAQDGPNSQYARAFLWVDAAAKDKFGSYKLQIGDVVDGKLVAIPRAIFAVAAVLQGGRGGVDIPESDQASIKRTVSAYYKKMDKVAPWDDDSKSVTALSSLVQDMRSFRTARA